MIFKELHISNLLHRFTSIDSVIPVQSVQIFQSPYMIIYPFMNCGSYPDFAQRMGSHLTFTDKIEVNLFDDIFIFYILSILNII